MAGLLHSPTDSEVVKYIKNHDNFHVDGRKQKENVEQVEKLLESNGYSVRVKTKGREATMLIPVLNVWNVTAQLAHTIATFDPDWVIYKAAFGSKIEVKYFGDA
ncbi:MAG: hypothetical protein U9O56_08095 [Campylobacterota bacterium]|nr:hypothetical protein [Campylobacterota bacterium]